MHKINLHAQPVPSGHLFYCQTQKSSTQAIFYGILLCNKELEPFGCERTEPQTAMIIWFVVLQ